LFYIIKRDIIFQIFFVNNFLTNNEWLKSVGGQSHDLDNICQSQDHRDGLPPSAYLSLIITIILCRIFEVTNFIKVCSFFFLKDIKK